MSAETQPYVPYVNYTMHKLAPLFDNNASYSILRDELDSTNVEIDPDLLALMKDIGLPTPGNQKSANIDQLIYCLQLINCFPQWEIYLGEEALNNKTYGSTILQDRLISKRNDNLNVDHIGSNAEWMKMLYESGLSYAFLNAKDKNENEALVIALIALAKSNKAF